MNTNKQAISLLELIFSILIGAILLISVVNLSLDLNTKDTNDYDKNINKIEFESLRLFLQKKLQKNKNLDNLSFSNKTIYYNHNVLLKNVNKYEKYISNNIIILDICIKNKILMCQEIRLKNGI